MSRVGLGWLALAWSCAGCALAEAGAREEAIIGGEPATAEQIHGTVALAWVRSESELFACTGTLIAPSMVVTAAHCVLVADPATGAITRRAEPAEMLVIAGALRPFEEAPPSAFHRVARISPHPGWPRYTGPAPSGLGRYDDIATVHLERPVTAVLPVRVLPLARVEEVLPPGATVTMSGYGRRAPDEGSESGTLYIADTPLLERSPFEMLVGGGENPDGCFGDSGGPVYVVASDGLYLAGAISRSRHDAPAPCGHGGVHTLVPAYLDWIESTSRPPPIEIFGGNCGVGRRGARGVAVALGLGVALVLARRRQRRCV